MLFAGVTAMEVRVPLLTVRVAEAEMLPEDAVITEEPAATACARPLVGTVLLTLAIVVFADTQLTVLVTSCVLPSVNVPVALNC